MFGLQHRARALRAGVCKPWREYFSRSLSFWVGRPRPAHESLLALPVCAGMGGGLWSNGDTAKSSHECGSTGRGGRMKEGKSKRVKGGNAAVSPNTCWFCCIFRFTLRLFFRALWKWSVCLECACEEGAVRMLCSVDPRACPVGTGQVWLLGSNPTLMTLRFVWESWILVTISPH